MDNEVAESTERISVECSQCKKKSKVKVKTYNKLTAKCKKYICVKCRPHITRVKKEKKKYIKEMDKNFYVFVPKPKTPIEFTEIVCHRPDIYLNNDRQCNAKDNVCPFLDRCVCTLKKEKK